MKYISNSFSLQMQGEHETSASRISLAQAKSEVTGLVPGPYIDRASEKDGSDAVSALKAQSCVGHADIAAVLSGLIGHEVPVNRISVSLKPGDTLIVGQYVGPRLPEGCKMLPEGAKIEWYMVTCSKAGNMNRLSEMQRDFAAAAADFEWPEIGQKKLMQAAEKHFPEYFQEDAFE